MLFKKLILTSACVALALQSHAQDSLLLHDYQFVKQADPWLTSHNAAALSRHATKSYAQAELSFTGEKGGFTNYNGAPGVLQFNGAIESFYRISKRTVLYGQMSYDNFSGNDMAGSGFIDTYHLPFDIVEDSLTNLGRKHRNTYHLTGSFGTDVYRGIAIGARVDYTAADYAKYKDLRHQNKLMDLQVRAGVYFPMGRWGSIGANYLYRRKTESVSFSTIGTSDKVYKSLIDYANFTGYVEQFGNDGFTDKSREMPLVNNYHGGSVQLGLRFDAHTQLFGEVTYTHRTGYYGRKSPFTITYTDHSSDEFSVTTRLSHRMERTMHHIDLTFGTENLVNRASTYHETKNEQGATNYEYFTPVKMANKLWTNYSVAYTLETDIRNGKEANGLLVDGLPTWTIQAGISSMERKQTAYIYPYYRSQHLQNFALFGSVAYTLTTRHGWWSFALKGSFGQGEGKPYEDLTFTKPSSKQLPPPSMEAYLYREYQYLTSAQYMVGGQVKYNFRFPGTAIMTHARLSLSHRKANETNTYSDGCDRTSGTIAIGCTF